MVASVILADVEPWLPARRNGGAMETTFVTHQRFILRTIFPGGRMPPSTAGKDARRHICGRALKLIFALLIVGLGCALFAVPAALAADEVVRPMIWATPADRAAILAKIETQPWAKSSFAGLKARVADAVTRHQKDPAAFLREIPTIPSPAGAQFHPTFAPIRGNMASTPQKGAGPKLERLLSLGVDCGALYYLTGDESYANCAADILNVFVEALVQMKTDETDEDGGLLYPNDFLYEARGIGDQIPLIYDFVQHRLKSGATVYNLGSKSPAPFHFEHAQSLFRAYARFSIDHGIVDNNHPVLEMNCLAHCVLALDDNAERADLLQYLTHKDTPHQDSLKKVVAVYAKSGAVWPESFQYSSSVSSRVTYLMALMRRHAPQDVSLESFANIPLSLVRLRDMRFPNGQNIRFGDGPRGGGGGSYDSCEIAYALGQREGDVKLQQTFGGLINRGIAEGKYKRSGQGTLALLWHAPEVIAPQADAVSLRTTDELPFVGAVLQRNLSPDSKPADALMAVVSGGHHVHGHASGMALELYGVGQVLGVNAGKGTYTTDEHENYRRIFAAHNCVIVNGASRSEGGWVNLGINTVQKVALEPAVGALPVSGNYSFTLTSFADDKGPGAKAKQERLVGIVRTSASTGYYVDVFRSESALPNQFHDYLYHNFGDAVTLASARGELALADSPGRFVPVKDAVWKQNRSFLYPGWHFFKHAKTSAPFAEDVTVDFSAAKLQPAPAHMRLFIPGGPGRDYSSALAPETKEAPGGYDKKPTPVLVIRQQGEAWTRPFAVVYEPSAGDGKAGSIQSVTALETNAAFVGFKIVSRVDGQPLTQYVLVQPTADSVYENAALGISFRGRYAVITVNASGAGTSLYLGEGERLRFQDYDLHGLAEGSIAASAEIAGNTATVTAVASAELTLPGGRRVASARLTH